MTKDLKAFVRFDGQGKIVPGTLIVQSFKPKVGRWEEISVGCCSNTSGLSGVIIPNDYEFMITPLVSCFTIQLLCEGNQFLYAEDYCGIEISNITELIAALNTEFSMFGKFELSGIGNVSINLASDIFKFTNCDPSLITFGIGID